MKKLEWSEHFSVGVKLFDDQHKELLSSVNKIISERDEMVSRITLADHFREFNNLIHTHFNSEEELLDKLKYPDLRHHISEHREYFEKFSDMLMNAIWEKEKTVDELIHFILEWWPSHVLNEDMKYKSFFKENGIS